MHRNPRKITWTVLYRRKHKKGTTEEVAKKRTRRNIKFQRSVQGATLENILAKRNQKPEVRKAQREQAIRLVCNLSLYLPWVSVKLGVSFSFSWIFFSFLFFFFNSDSDFSQFVSAVYHYVQYFQI